MLLEVQTIDYGALVIGLNFQQGWYRYRYDWWKSTRSNG